MKYRTWLNAISHLCEMTAAIIQGWLLFQGDTYCNVIMIATTTIQKSGSFMVQIILFVTYYSILLGTLIHRYKFFSKSSSLAIEFQHR